MAWNPRYVLYAKMKGRTPEQQAEADPIEWPGGCMCGFSLWIQERWRTFAAWFCPECCTVREVFLNHRKVHEGFDAWLETHLT